METLQLQSKIAKSGLSLHTLRKRNHAYRDATDHARTSLWALVGKELTDLQTVMANQMRELSASPDDKLLVLQEFRKSRKRITTTIQSQLSDLHEAVELGDDE